MSELMKLAGDDLKNAIQEGLSLVVFGASWCAPCKQMEPILENLASKIGDQAKIIKADAEENMDIARELNVSAVPLSIIFRDGQEIKRIMGLQKEEDLARELFT